MQSITHFDIWTDANPVFRIKDLIDELEYASSTLQEATCNNIVTRLTEDGAHKAVQYNATAPQSNPQRSTIRFAIEGSIGEISLEGPGAVYDEFGTGERGADDGHPMKSDFPLNPYNSGSFVSTHVNQNGRHYWFAPRWSSDPYMFSNGYTEGIPSGKQMYNTLQYVREIKNDIIKDEINNALSTLK